MSLVKASKSSTLKLKSPATSLLGDLFVPCAGLAGVRACTLLGGWGEQKIPDLL